MEGAPRVACCGVSSPPSHHLVGEDGGGGWVVAPGSIGDSAASSPPGVEVAGSLRSQESLVLAAPSSVASSVYAEHDHRSCSCEIGGVYRGPLPLFTVFSLARSRLSWRASLCPFAVWGVA